VIFAALAYAFCLIVGQEIFFITYALWMQSSFNLALGTLGLATIVLGFAEAGGELVVSAAGDRLGMHNMALYGAILAGIGFAVIPHLNQNIGVALVGMFVLFVLVEMAIVASIALFTEVLPDARSVMMSASMSAMSIGHLAGVLIGGGLYELTGSFALIGVVAMVIVLIGCAFMWMLRRVVQPA
jgi:predicted MFS family arabinose efflux permease